MISNPKILLIITCLLLILSSCREEIDLQLDSTYTRLIVEAYITNDTTRHKVMLSKSGPALNSGTTLPVSAAIVNITDGINTFPLTEDPSCKGSYLTDSTVFGIPGRTYTLNISNVDINDDKIMETYTAQSIMKNLNPIDSIEIIYEAMYGKGWIINLFTKDIGGGRNFYLVKAYKNSILLTDSAFKLANLADNTGFEGQYFNGFSAYYLRAERTDEKLNPGDIVTLELNAITPEYYDFLLEYIEEYYPKVPIFSGPSANISTNIYPKDKACGFFAVYALSRKSKTY